MSPMHLGGPGDDLAIRAFDRHRGHGVRGHEDLESPMRRLARSRVAAHLGHESRDDDLLDPVAPEMFLSPVLVNEPREMLGQDRLAGRRVRGGMDLGAGLPRPAKT